MKPGLGMAEELQVLGHSFRGVCVICGVGIAEHFVQDRFVERSGGSVVTRGGVHAGQQLRHLQGKAVTITPDLTQVVANVAAQHDSCVDVATTVASFHKTTANPDDNIQRPRALDNTRCPEVG